MASAQLPFELQAMYQQDPGQATRKSNQVPAQQSQLREAIRAYERAKAEGSRPGTRMVLQALKECASLKNLEAGERIAAAESWASTNSFVANTLVDMYAKCGRMEQAYRIFETINRRTVVSWTVLILGYAQNGYGKEALQLFDRMQDDDIAPNGVTFVAALKACCSLAEEEQSRIVEGRVLKLGSLQKGMEIHARAVEAGFFESSNAVANTLVDMYTKCGRMVEARRVFDSMQVRTVVSWSIMMLGYVKAGAGTLALEMFHRMQKGEEGGCRPNRVTFVAALKACGSLAEQETSSGGRMRWLEQGRSVFRQAQAAAEADITVANTALDMYGKCGSMEDALQLFKAMEQHSVVSWTVMIMGYAENGEGDRGMQMFAEMLECGSYDPNAVTLVAAIKSCAKVAEEEEGREVDGKVVKTRALEMGRGVQQMAVEKGYGSDESVGNSLVAMYGKCGSMVDARKVFQKLGSKTVVSWTALILGYVDNGEGKVAMQAFKRMRGVGCVPNAVAYVAALKACAAVGDLDAGRRIHVDVVAAELHEDTMVANSLVDFYGKCGSMREAVAVFAVATRDAVTWGALMNGYASQGDVAMVFTWFERMVTWEPRLGSNAVVFLALLRACSHAGMVDHGKRYFEAMWHYHGIAPEVEHYTCMVDMLGRANLLEDALAVAKGMEQEVRGTAVVWRSLLAACNKWKNAEVAKAAFEALMIIDKGNASAYVLMSNACLCQP